MEQHMTARTVSWDAHTETMEARTNPLRENPIRAAVADIRSLQDATLPNGGAVRDAGRARVTALIASGQYSLAQRSA